MKLLVYSSYFYPYISGITVYTQRVFAELAKEHKVKLLTFKHEDKLEDLEVLHNLQVKRMPFLFRLSKGFISPQSWLTFFNEIKNNEIVFINIPNAEALPLAFLARIFKKKLVAIFYCEVVLGNSVFERIIQFFLNLTISLQLALSTEIIMLPGYEKQSKLAKFFKNKIKFISPPIKKIAVNSNKYDELKKLKNDEIWIGFVGRLSREKGVEYLIDAVEIISKKNKNLKLVFAGPSGKAVIGEENYEVKIRKQLQSKNVKYEFLGFLEEAELGSLFASLNLLVLPSINKTEAFGMVQGEAMMHGVPVVASDLPGVNEAIKLTKMGELFDARNVEDLAKKIEKVLENKSKYIENKSLVMKTYNFHDTINSYEELLKRIS